MPEKPDENSSEQEWEAYRTWKEGYETWKHITCPCGWGYFDMDGIWISGEEVREGSIDPNPLWKSTRGKAPWTSQKESFKGSLLDRAEKR